MTQKNKFIKLGNLLVSEALIKAVKVFEDFELKVPDGYEGEPEKVFKVTVILHEVIRPQTGYSFNLFESDARVFLEQLDVDVAVGGNAPLVFTTEDYAKSVFTKLPDPVEEEDETGSDPDSSDDSAPVAIAA